MKRLLQKTLSPRSFRLERGPLTTYLLPLLLSLLLTSCYTTTYYTHPVEEDYNNTYMYCTAASIIEQFGKPTRVETAADGQEVVIYEKMHTVKDSKASDGPQREYLEFYFDSDSRCTAVKSNRVETVAQRVKSKPTRKSIMWGIGGGTVLLLEGIVFILLI